MVVKLCYEISNKGLGTYLSAYNRILYNNMILYWNFEISFLGHRIDGNALSGVDVKLLGISISLVIEFEFKTKKILYKSNLTVLSQLS